MANDNNKGTSNNDVFSGTNGNDKFDGLAGDDTLTGGTGNDNLTGGAGMDVAVFSGYYSEYQLTGGQGQGVVTVRDLRRDKPDGIDVLKEIEIIRFFDGDLHNGVFTLHNKAPTGTPSAVLPGGLEDTVYTVSAATLLQGISDPDGDVPVITTLVASAGSVTSAAGNYTITPPANFNGAVTLSYTVSDSKGGALAVTQQFTVATINDVPTGNPAVALPAATEDQAYPIAANDLLMGFSDVDGDALAVTALVTSTGSIAASGNGNFIFMAPADYAGEVTLQYDVSDGNGGIVAASRSFTVVEVNDAPAGTPSAQLRAGTEDSAYSVRATELLAGFSDADSDALGITGLTSSNGALTDSGDGSWILMPTAHYNGEVTLDYTISDGRGGIVQAQQRLTLTAVNDLPTGTPTAMLANGSEDVVYALTATDLLAGFTDVDGDTLAITGLTTSIGSLTQQGNNDWLLQNPANYFGPVKLDYQVVDGNGGSINASQTLSLASINDAPTGSATAVLVAGMEDQPYTVSATMLLAGFTDVDGDTLTVSGLAASTGTVADNGNHTFTITPVADYVGPVVLEYQVTDGQGGQLAASQQYQLKSANVAPVATADALSSYLPSIDLVSTRYVALATTTGHASVASPVALASALSFELADMDNDGDIDLVTGDTGIVRIRFNDGSGNFSTAAAVASYNGNPMLQSTVLTDIEIADFNGDGWLDVLATEGGGYQQHVLLRTVNGTYQEYFPDANLGTSTNVPLGGFVNAAATGDVDGDGDIDILFATAGIRLALNDGNGRFTLGSLANITLAGGSPLNSVLIYYAETAIGQLNGTGPADATFVQGFDTSFTYQDSTPVAGVGLESGVKADIALGDIDGDGDLDAVITGAQNSYVWNGVQGTDNTISVLVNNGSGGFTRTQQFATAGSNYAVEMIDMDGDADLDFIVSGLEGPVAVGNTTGAGIAASLRVYANNGAGNYTLTETIAAGTGIAQVRNIEGSDIDAQASGPNENTPYVFTGSLLTANDTDANSDALEVTDVSPVSALGALLSVTNNQLTYDPRSADKLQALAANDTVVDSFQYQVADGRGGSAWATATLVVGGKAGDMLGTHESKAVSGTAGNNTLLGLGGNDTLNGMDGDDRLFGGAGDDVLTGGTGRDVFIFNTGGGADRITDFTLGATGDLLELRPLLTGYHAGASTLADFIALQAGTGGTLVSVDADGASSGQSWMPVVTLVNLVGITLADLQANLA